MKGCILLSIVFSNCEYKIFLWGKKDTAGWDVHFCAYVCSFFKGKGRINLGVRSQWAELEGVHIGGVW